MDNPQEVADSEAEGSATGTWFGQSCAMDAGGGADAWGH